MTNGSLAAADLSMLNAQGAVVQRYSRLEAACGECLVAPGLRRSHRHLTNYIDVSIGLQPGNRQMIATNVNIPAIGNGCCSPKKSSFFE